jgi:four helix bundle protein
MIVCKDYLVKGSYVERLSAISFQLSLNQHNIVMRNFRNLKVWKKSHELVLSVYNSTASFPKEELYGLVSQLRRSAASIPSNIAEGYGRNTQSQMAHFLNISLGSASELEYQVLLAKDLNFINDSVFHEQTELIHAIKRMLTSLLQKVSADS